MRRCASPPISPPTARRRHGAPHPDPVQGARDRQVAARPGARRRRACRALHRAARGDPRSCVAAGAGRALPSRHRRQGGGGPRRGAGARTLAEPPGAGLNPALRLARDAISAEASADLLVLPIDLPLACAAALRALLAVAGDAVAAPDRHGLGTNALYLVAAAAPRFDFRFGEASLAAHRAAAEALGLRFSLYEDPALAFDLDRPEDLRDWRDGASAAAAARRP
jgi:2-phospho-L-lactate guanylyltransferase